MDLFVLDSQLRRTAVFDQYESLIWTERFNSAGEFKLVIPASRLSRTILVQGTRLAINESTRVMTIDTVIDRKDSEGRVFLEIEGPSLEDMLNDRTARTLVPNSDITDLKWYFDDMLPAAIAREIFDYICVEANLDVGDTIPFYTVGNIYPTDTIPEPADTVSMSIKPTTLYEAIRNVCQIYDLGFRLVRNGDESELMFNIYSGNDHTTLQSELPAVIFAPEFDNLNDVSYLTSIAGYKNVANVISPDGSVFAYADGIDPSIAGFERKVLTVDASDIRYLDRAEMSPAPYIVTTDEAESVKVAQQLTTTTQFQQDSLSKLTRMQRLYPQDIVNINTVITLAGSPLTTAQKDYIADARDTNIAFNPTEDAILEIILTQKGKEELSKNTSIAAFDGEIPKNSQYLYHRDYELGDLVEIRNGDQATQQMRVTEQIFASDATGDQSYPTLSVKLLITAGSWYAEPTTEVWDDLTSTTDTWESRP